MKKSFPQNKSVKRKANKNKKGSAWLWIITICLIISLSAFLLMVTREQQREAANIPQYPVNSAPKEPKVQNRKFEFYERLPEKKVIVPGTQPPPPPEMSVPTEEYLLQIATVKTFNEADTLKAELTLLGFTVNIQTTTIDNQTAYRVLSGPFADHATAAVAQQELKTMQFNSQIVKK